MVRDDEKGTCLVYVNRLMWLPQEIDLLFSLLKAFLTINLTFGET